MTATSVTATSRESILVVDDDSNLRATLKELLEAQEYRVFDASNGQDALQVLEGGGIDLVLCDWKMPVRGGEELLRSLAERDEWGTPPVIIMTAHGTGPNAITSMQLGAYDFIVKPFDLDEMMATIRRAMQHVALQKEVHRLRRATTRNAEEREISGRRMVGTSPAMIEVFKAIGRVAQTDIPVLLLGETGTGKELAARSIHENSARRGRPFVVINCAALPHDLLESELFGHEKGAFTGALARKTGKFEAAGGGTVFLDEVGELPLSLQPKLLRVLQEHTFERVGGTESISADFRVVTATNRVLEDEVEEKRFRSDLYYRLKVFSIPLPPLRARRSDIFPLAEHILARYNERNHQRTRGFSDDAIVALQQYAFPGNIRELEHIVESVAVAAGNHLITLQLLQSALAVPSSHPTELSLASLLKLPFHASVREWEKRLVMTALEESDGNKSDAARRLEIHRRLLYEKIRQLGLDGGDDASE